MSERSCLSVVGTVARLWLVLAANLALVTALVLVAIAAHSIGVLAEGVDYLADAAAIGISLLAIKLSSQPPDPSYPHRYSSAPDYAALVNAGWLLIVSALVMAAALAELLDGVRTVNGLPVLIVSGVAATVMLAAALLLRGEIAGGGDLNRRAVLLDTAADAATAAGVAAAGAIIYLTHGHYWLDPTVAAVIAVIVGWHAARLLTEIRSALRH